MVHEAFLTPDRLDRYALVILANAAALSDAQCAALRAYVERGGGLLATFESSRYDEEGRQRPDFGLADLFGVRDAGGVEGPLKNSYLTLETDADGALLVNGQATVGCADVATANATVHIIDAVLMPTS